jgi:hypothetical protein
LCTPVPAPSAQALDSGKGGGETIRVIFEEKLVGSLRALNIRDFYSTKNVKAVIDAADGYQPHLVRGHPAPPRA